MNNDGSILHSSEDTLAVRKGSNQHQRSSKQNIIGFIKLFLSSLAHLHLLVRWDVSPINVPSLLPKTTELSPTLRAHARARGFPAHGLDVEDDQQQSGRRHEPLPCRTDSPQTRTTQATQKDRSRAAESLKQSVRMIYAMSTP